MHIIQDIDTVKMHGVAVSPTAEELVKDSLVNYAKQHCPVNKHYELF